MTSADAIVADKAQAAIQPNKIDFLKVFPYHVKKTVVNIKHSLDKGLYTEIESKKRFDKGTVGQIKAKMKEIVDSDLHFNAVNVSRDDAYEYSLKTVFL